MHLNRRIYRLEKAEKETKVEEQYEVSRAKNLIVKIKGISKSTIISTILVLFLSASLNPISTAATNFVSKWWTGITTGISLSVPPDSILAPTQGITLNIRNAKYIRWSWDDNIGHTDPGPSVKISPITGKGTHVLVFQQVDSDDPNANTYNDNSQKVSYTVLADAPMFELSPQKTQFKPGDTITIKATDKDGIFDIGWAWDKEPTTQEIDPKSILKDNKEPSYSVTITIPNDFEGDHVLKYYARDNTKDYNIAGWISYRINVNTDRTKDTNNISILTTR